MRISTTLIIFLFIFTNFVELTLLSATPSDLDKKLADAVEFVHSNSYIEALLMDGANPNTKFNYNSYRNFSPLTLSIYRNKLEISELLLKYGGKIEYNDIDTSNALLELAYSSSKGNRENINLHKLQSIDFLLKQNVPINITNRNGESFFSKATSSGNLELVVALIERNSDINLCDHNGNSALHLAAERNFPDIAKLLLKHNAQIDLKNKDDQTPLAIAFRRGSLEVAKLLKDHGATTSLDEVLKRFSSRDDDRGIEMIINNSINISNDALSRLVRYGKIKLALLALQRDKTFKPDLKLIEQIVAYEVTLLEDDTQDFQTLLDILFKRAPEIIHNKLFFQLISNNYILAVKELLNSAVDPNIRDEHGFTALNTASGSGKLEVVQALLNKGANINETSGYSERTALSEAIAHEKLEVVKLLIGRGADIHRKNSKGSSPLDEAKYTANINILDIIVESGAKGLDLDELYKEAFIRAAGVGDLTNSESLLKKIVDINVYSRTFDTALTAAVTYGKIQNVNVLIQAGVNLDLPKGPCDRESLKVPSPTSQNLPMQSDVLMKRPMAPSHICDTPLILASGLGEIKILRRLLDAGAKVNQQKLQDNSTALMHAAKHGDPEIVKILLTSGADRNIRDTKGKTAYDYALESENTKVAGLIKGDT